MINFNDSLGDNILQYKKYVQLFFDQISTPAIYKELTGEDESYSEYVERCSNNLYNFQTWFEHTTNKEFPKSWNEYSNLKFPIGPRIE